MRRSRYKDFVKSEKQARKDYESFFEGVPVVNEVEAPEVESYNTYCIHDFRTKETVFVNESAKKMFDRMNKECIGNKAQAIEAQYRLEDYKESVGLLAASLVCVVMTMLIAFYVL
jgi:aspartate carbamoyltransferase regulatory subunit